MSCGQDAIAVRFIGESLPQLRRELGEWAVAGQRRRAGWAHESVNARQAHVRAKFDRVVRWWHRQPDLDPEWAKLLRDFHNRSAPPIEQSPSSTAAASPSETQSTLLDPDRLRELTDTLKSHAEEESESERLSDTPEAPKEIRPWRIFRHPPPSHGDNDS
jgi:hypothetical protein